EVGEDRVSVPALVPVGRVANGRQLLDPGIGVRYPIAQVMQPFPAGLDKLAVGTGAVLPLDQFNLEVAAAAKGDFQPDVLTAATEIGTLHRPIRKGKRSEDRTVLAHPAIQVFDHEADLVNGRQAQALEGGVEIGSASSRETG